MVILFFKKKETSPSDLHFFNMSQCVEAEIYPPHHALINGARFCLLRQQWHIYFLQKRGQRMKINVMKSRDQRIFLIFSISDFWMKIFFIKK